MPAKTKGTPLSERLGSQPKGRRYQHRKRVAIFLCYTPLHLIIAKAIQDRERRRDVILTYLPDSRSAVHDNYFINVAPAFTKALRGFLERKFLPDLINIVRLAYRINRQCGARSQPIIYTGNLKVWYTRALIALIRPSFINTFDDGNGNIAGRGYFYDFCETGPLAKLTTSLLPALAYRHLAERIDTHFTIYDYENVYARMAKKCVRLSVFQARRSGPDEQSTPGSTVRILLTGPFSEHNWCSLADEVDMYNRSIQAFDIDVRLPHPGERRDKTPLLSCRTIETNLIAEDYILGLAGSTHAFVCGFGSTTLINLLDYANVDLVCLRDDHLGIPATDLFHRLGIPMKTI